MKSQELENTARAMVAPGKGILAIDESFSTIGKRFEKLDIESSERNRAAYRELMFTTSGVEEFVSGVILFDETLRQKSNDGTPFTEILNNKGIIPGIKVDTGAKPLAGSPQEKITEGLDGLRERLAEYREIGARFAKWRAVITIGDGIPSRHCLKANANALARYAALCQEAGIVPIVEPEVLMDGDHSIERCEQITSETLHIVFNALHAHGIVLEQMVLKPNMVISGEECSKQASVQEVAEATARTLLRSVPAAVPGIVFLSGGQSDELATVHLSVINTLQKNYPWTISFSYGRALQTPAMTTWKGQPSNIPAAQKAFYHRCRMNSLAAYGKYSEEMEKELAA